MAVPISTALQAALRSRDQRLAFRCDILQDGVPILTGLRVTSGSLAVSSSQSPRRSVILTAVDDGGDLVPGDPSDFLAPYGNEIAVYQGLSIPSTSGPLTWTDDLVPMGVFRIDHATSAYAGDGVTVAINGPDRSGRVADADFEDYTQIAAATDVGAAIRSIVSPALPASQLYAFTPVSAVIAAQTYAPGDDRWEKASTLAGDVGCVLAFDPNGVLTLQPIIDPGSTKPVWSFADGEASVLTGVTSDLDRTQAANVIVVIAQSTGNAAALIATAEDDDPTSPTWVGGPFGRVVKTFSTSALTTQADVQAYADAQLLLYKGATQQISLTGITLPHLDALDVINVEEAQVKVSSKYVIDQLSIPLGVGTMSITTRGVLV